MTFWPNIKCDIPSNILMHTMGLLHVQAWNQLKGHGMSICYHGRIMEFKGSEGA